MKMIFCVGLIAMAQAALIEKHEAGSHTFLVDSAVGFKVNETVVFPGCSFTTTVIEVKHVDKIKEKHHVQTEEDTSTIKVKPAMPKDACPGVMTIWPFTPATTTTALAAFDSSASSGSGASSDSLASSGSGPAGSFNTGSSASLLYGLSGSWESGSWGSQLQLWQWDLLLALLCCCFGACGAAGFMMKAKPKKSKKSKSKPKAVEPEAAQPLMVAEPVMTVPPLLPLATSSQLIPSYSMVTAAPAMTAYAAPASYQYAAMPATTSYITAPGQVV